VGQLRVGQDVGPLVDRPAGHVRRPQAVERLGGGERLERGGELLPHGQGVLHPGEPRGEPGVVEQVAPPQGLHAAAVLLLGGPHGRDPAVGGVVGRVPVRVVGNRLLVGQGLVPHGVGPEERHRRIQHVELDVLATLTPGAGHERRHHRMGGGHRRDLVGHERLHEGSTLHGGQARQPLHDGVVHRLVGVGAVGSEPRDRRVHELRIGLGQRPVPEPQPVDHAGSEVLHEDVGRRREAEDQLVAARIAQVHRHGPFVAVESHPGPRHVADRRPGHPHGVVAAHRLDHHHVGAVVGQQRTGERAGHSGGDVDHPEPRQRAMPHAGNLREPAGPLPPALSWPAGRSPRSPGGWAAAPATRSRGSGS
jgi:hypothetical protein